MKQIVKILFLSTLLVSCAKLERVSYFQDIDQYMKTQLESDTTNYTTTLRPDDELSITVSSVDPIAVAPFNLLVSASVPNAGVSINNTVAMQSYIVDKEGYINFPTLGKIKAEGMTRENLVLYLENRLKEYVKEPVVNVRIVNFKVSVLGEVTAPGVYYFSGYRVSVLDVLAAAKDITMYGRRDNVLLIRDNNGKKEYIRINLQKSEMLTSSYFYLQQNDMIYIEPNKQRQDDANVGTNKQYKTSILTSAISYTLNTVSILVTLFIATNKN